MCRAECEIAFKSIPEGQEIEKLKNKKTEAIDYIMGFKKVLDDTLTNPTTTADKDTGWATSNVDNYRYYAFVIHITSNVNVAYDFGIDGMKVYGDYY